LTLLFQQKTLDGYTLWVFTINRQRGYSYPRLYWKYRIYRNKMALLMII